jgi:hypothetical protein
MNRIMWARYGHYLTLKEVTEDGVQVIQNFMSCLMGQLLLRPMDSGACIAMRFPASVLEHVISGTAKFNGADLNKCVNGAIELVNVSRGYHCQFLLMLLFQDSKVERALPN